MPELVDRLGGHSMIRQVLFHAIISLLALGIAFSLPAVAGYVLYDWWPRVMASSKALLATEIGLAALLVVLFHGLRMAWNGLRVMRCKSSR